MAIIHVYLVCAESIFANICQIQIHGKKQKNIIFLASNDRKIVRGPEKSPKISRIYKDS